MPATASSNSGLAPAIARARIGRAALPVADGAVAQAGSSSPAAVGMPRLSIRDGVAEAGTRVLAEECPVALTFNGTSLAVMMASPCDLEDFALGFSLTEGIIDDLDEVRDLQIVTHPDGYEVRGWLSEAAASRLSARRRRLLGPVGCGLCGIESIEEAIRPSVQVPDVDRRISAAEIRSGLRALEAAQDLNRRTRSHHAAALWDGANLVVREDIGRHNALDKLAGALLRAPFELAGAVVIVTSRASVDLVQKTARLGASILVAISAPTGLAVRSATASGLTLVGVARGDGFEVYSRPDRIVVEAS